MVHKSTKPPSRISEGDKRIGKRLDSRREAPDVKDGAKKFKKRKMMSRSSLHQTACPVDVVPVIALNPVLQPKLAAKFPHLIIT